MCPLRFRVSSFSDNFRVKRSVGSLLSSWYGPESISVDIFAWYVSASRITSRNKWVSLNEAVTIVLWKCSVMLEVFDFLRKHLYSAAQVLSITRAFHKRFYKKFHKKISQKMSQKISQKVSQKVSQISSVSLNFSQQWNFKVKFFSFLPLMQCNMFRLLSFVAKVISKYLLYAWF